MKHCLFKPIKIQDRSSRNSQSDYYSNEESDEMTSNNNDLLEQELIKKQTFKTKQAAEYAFASSLSSYNNVNNSTNTTIVRHVSSRQVKLIVISFGIRILCTGLLWDHFVHKYHDLLMVTSSNPTQRVIFFY